MRWRVTGCRSAWKPVREGRPEGTGAGELLFNWGIQMVMLSVKLKENFLNLLWYYLDNLPSCENLIGKNFESCGLPFELEEGFVCKLLFLFHSSAEETVIK